MEPEKFLFGSLPFPLNDIQYKFCLPIRRILKTLSCDPSPKDQCQNHKKSIESFNKLQMN